MVVVDGSVPRWNRVIYLKEVASSRREKRSGLRNQRRSRGFRHAPIYCCCRCQSMRAKTDSGIVLTGMGRDGALGLRRLRGQAAGRFRQIPKALVSGMPDAARSWAEAVKCCRCHQIAAKTVGAEVEAVEQAMGHSDGNVPSGRLGRTSSKTCARRHDRCVAHELADCSLPQNAVGSDAAAADWIADGVGCRRRSLLNTRFEGLRCERWSAEARRCQTLAKDFELRQAIEQNDSLIADPVLRGLTQSDDDIRYVALTHGQKRWSQSLPSTISKEEILAHLSKGASSVMTWWRRKNASLYADRSDENSGAPAQTNRQNKSSSRVVLGMTPHRLQSQGAATDHRVGCSRVNVICLPSWCSCICAG